MFRLYIIYMSVFQWLVSDICQFTTQYLPELQLHVFYLRNKFHMMLRFLSTLVILVIACRCFFKKQWFTWSTSVFTLLLMICFSYSSYKVLFYFSHDHCVSLHNFFRLMICLTIFMKKRFSSFSSLAIPCLNFCSTFKVSFSLTH